jgi:hypothetical protein
MHIGGKFFLRALTMRNLKSKRETLSDKEARKVKGGLKYDFNFKQ